MAKGPSPCSRQPRARGRRYACEYGRSVARRRQGGVAPGTCNADEAAPMGGGRARPPLRVTRFNLVHGSRVPGGRMGSCAQQQGRAHRRSRAGSSPCGAPGAVRARRPVRSAPKGEVRAVHARAGAPQADPQGGRQGPQPGGSSAMADRIVQASLKLVLEPIFEADFHPSSYGAGRRAQDAIAEIHKFTSRPADYEWVFEADIEACFDEIDHTALMGRVRERVGDKRILALIRGLSEAGVLSEDGVSRRTLTGTPQGGISCLRCWPISPYPSWTGTSNANGTHWVRTGERAKHRRRGGAVMKMIRLRRRLRRPRPRDAAASARALRAEVGRVLAPMGLRLSADKTRLTHIEEGFEFLGWRIQRRKKKGTRGTTRALHLPVEEVTGFDHRQDPDPDPQDGSSDTRRPPAQTQPGDPRLVRLFPARGLQAHVLLRRQLRLPANTRLALQAPPPPEQAHRQPPVPARVAHPGRRNRVLPSLQGPRDPLPLPGNPHPQSPRRRTPRHNTGGEPDAQECARPVRRAAGGNPPAKTRAGRRRPTLHLRADLVGVLLHRLRHGACSPAGSSAGPPAAARGTDNAVGAPGQAIRRRKHRDGGDLEGLVHHSDHGSKSPVHRLHRATRRRGHRSHRPEPWAPPTTTPPPRPWASPTSASSSGATAPGRTATTSRPPPPSG